MIPKTIVNIVIGLCPALGLAQTLNTFYCAQGHSNISLGMTADQVKAECGDPQMTDGSATLTQKIPVTRLTYNNMNKGSVYYWNLNKVYNQFGLPSGSSITPFTVDIVNNKVKALNLNGNSVKTTTACGYQGNTGFPGGTNPNEPASIGVGDPADKVYSLCGAADYTDETYIDAPIPPSDKPQHWTYQVDSYHPAYQLLFVRGRLVEIEQ